MGMYTELDIKVCLNTDKIDEVKAVMPVLLNSLIQMESLPDHPFFHCDRFPGFLSRSNGLTKPNSYLQEIYPGCYYLFVDTCLKNYDKEIQHFLDWLFQYTHPDEDCELVGYYRYEEDEYYRSVFLTPTGFVIKQGTGQ